MYQRRHPLRFLACGVLLAIPVAVLAAAEQTSPRGFDLRRLEVLCFGKLAPDQAARVYLSFLQEEIATPSPESRGLGGGPITHDYILAQIILAGWEARADRNVLWAAAAAAPPGGYRDAITITLGLLGDTRVREALIQYLGNPANPPRLRQRAARALGAVPHPSVVAPLAAALRDPASEVASGVGPTRKVYYVRGTVVDSLRKVQRAGVDIPAAVQQAMAATVTMEPLTPGKQ